MRVFRGDGAADFDGNVEALAAEEARPVFTLAEQEPDEIIGRTIGLLVEANNPMTLFVNSEVLVSVGNDAIKPVSKNKLTEWLTKLSYWRTASGARSLPNDKIVSIVLESDDLLTKLPAVESITNTPVFSLDGRFETEPGYHESTRSYYRPAAGFTVPPVPEAPTEEEVERAKSLILGDVLVDFPFVGEADRAHAVAMLITGFVRSMLLKQDAPMFIFDAPTPGTGKGLVSNAIGTILTGGRIEMMPDADNHEEWRKRLFAALLEGKPIIAFDNLHNRVDNPTLCALLTGGGLKDRVLGISRVVFAPTRSILVGTGNNVEVSKESVRRFAWSRIADPTGRPTRPGRKFKHPDLLDWIDANRGDLVWAVGVLVRRWFAAGQPVFTGRVRPSYERWSEVVGGIMECVGLPGVNGNYDERNDEDYDPVEAGLKTLVGRWASKFGTKNGRSQDVWTVYDRALGLIDPRITDAAAGALAIGNVIGKKMLDNVYNGWFVRRRGKVRGSVTWYLERAQEEATDEAA
jgi:putative DNA primase/helicase